MPTIIISIKHKIGQAEALRRIKAYADNAPNILPNSISNFKIGWKDHTSEFSFAFTNIIIKGNLSVNHEKVSITSKIPFIFLPLKVQIEKVVRQSAAEILKY